WPDELHESSDGRSGHAAVSFGSVSDIDLEFVKPVDPMANWLLPIMDAGALAVSIRGALEPTQLTREELRKNRRNYLNDQQEQMQNARMSRGEQEEKIATRESIEVVDGSGCGSPRRVESAALGAMDGKIRDFSMLDTAAEIQPMEHRQDKAWVEMMLASTIRANPNIQDMPIQNIATSGL